MFASQRQNEIIVSNDMFLKLAGMEPFRIAVKLSYKTSHLRIHRAVD